MALDPIERERIEAAIKSALTDSQLSISEAGRQLGRGSNWIGSILQRVRNGMTLTAESVRIMRMKIPTIEEHLRLAGWTAFGSVRSRPVIATRSTEHLRLHMSNLMRKRDELDAEIRETAARIAELEEMVRENG